MMADEVHGSMDTPFEGFGRAPTDLLGMKPTTFLSQVQDLDTQS